MNPLILSALTSVAADAIFVAGSLLVFTIGLLCQRLIRKALG